MFAKQQKGSPSPSKLSTPTSEQAQHETQPQSEPQSSGQSHISSEFPTTPVGKRKVSALEDSGVSKPQGSPTKKPRLGSASPRKGGLSPTVSLCLSHASLTLLLTVAETEGWTNIEHHRFLCKENPSIVTRHPFVCEILFIYLVPFASQSRIVFECTHNPLFSIYRIPRLPNLL